MKKGKKKQQKIILIKPRHANNESNKRAKINKKKVQEENSR